MASAVIGWKELFLKRFGSADKDAVQGTREDDTDEEWCLLEVNTDMETVYTGDHRDPSEHPPRRKSGGASMRALLGSPLGGKSNSKVKGDRSPRPGSPSGSPLQRRPSGRGNKQLEVPSHENGGGKLPMPRSASPGRSMMKGKGSSSNILKVDEHSSGGSGVDHPLTQPPRVTEAGDAEGGDVGSFAKVRDTLRIRRTKKRKKVGGVNYAAHQYSAPEINLHNPSKYQDPFEAGFTESTEETGKGHEFKTVSIPHNKPEYCDHCGDNAWGYRQVLRCTKCDFIVHRKCEQKVNIDCSARLERAVLQHDKRVEEADAASEDRDEKEESDLGPAPLCPSSGSLGPSATSHANPHQPPSSTSSSPSSSSSSSTPSLGIDYMAGGSSHQSSQVLSERTKLSRRIRDYNRKTTPVHHIHIKSSLHIRDENLFYQGFVRVHMCVQRPIHVSTAITRTSWYRLMRPVKERSHGGVEGFETAFYLPTDTNRLVHISNTTTTKELIQILLKKFCVTDNPKKFSLYEEYGSDSRRLFEEDCPLTIVLEASAAHRNSKLVLRDNTYSTIQWDAFSPPELSNFIQILHREEDLYAAKIRERFQLWKTCVSQVLKEKTMEEVARQTRANVQTSQRSSTVPGKGPTRTRVQARPGGTKSARKADSMHTKV